MTNELALKAQHKGRCLKFPGYCDKSAETCDKYHPVVQCRRYPNCSYPHCTFLHPLCEYDCAKLNCPEVTCIKFHPFRAYYNEKYRKRLPDTYQQMESDFHILIEESDANLIDRKPLPGFEINYDSNYSVRQTSNSFGYGSKYMTQPFERLNRVSSTSDIIFPSVLAVDADYDLRQEIQAVQENISTMGINVIYSRFFNFSSCLGCRKRAASQYTGMCQHVIFCPNCLEKNRTKNGYFCALCGICSEKIVSLL